MKTSFFSFLIKGILVVMLFSNRSIAQDSSAVDEQSRTAFKWEGYVDAYLARYSDSLGYGTPQQFQFLSPMNNTFGLNVLQLSGEYDKDNYRAKFTLQYGDIPKVAFSSDFNMVKEAIVGIGLKKLWLDAGIFYNYMGSEEVTPKDNYLSTNAVGSYHLPSNYAGIRASYVASEKLGLELHIMNGHDLVVDNNQSKSIGLVVDYNPFENLEFYYCNYIGDDREDSVTFLQTKFLHHFSVYYTAFEKLNLIISSDYGSQKNSGILLQDSSKTAQYFSLFSTINYQFWPNFSATIRLEQFNDPEGFLSGSFVNSDSVMVGLKIYGFTLGVEYKPSEKSYIRLEARQDRTDEKLDIFYNDNKWINSRNGLVFTMGVWF